MKNNTPVLNNSSWITLLSVAVIIFIASLYLLGYLFTAVAEVPLAFLLLFTIGVVMFVGGYILTKRSQYEIFPQSKQIFGALLNGVLGGIMLLSLIKILLDGPIAIPLVSFLIAVGLYLEFFSSRVFQGKKITLLQILSVLLVATSFYLLKGNAVVVAHTLDIGLFLGAMVLFELNSYTTNTYLLSPWVNSIWNGLAILGVSVIAFPYVLQINLLKDINTILLLPLWVGLCISFLGVALLALRFFKQKVKIARGYMQYKLQLWTVSVGVLSLLAVFDKVSSVYVVVFVILTLSYSIMEGRLVVKE